jgi:hypothetical protein
MSATRLRMKFLVVIGKVSASARGHLRSSPWTETTSRDVAGRHKLGAGGQRLTSERQPNVADLTSCFSSIEREVLSCRPPGRCSYALVRYEIPLSRLGNPCALMTCERSMQVSRNRLIAAGVTAGHGP